MCVPNNAVKSTNCFDNSLFKFQGINSPDVDGIIFFGVTETIVDFEQKAGRGGRDGRPCFILTLAEDWVYAGFPSELERQRANPKATGDAAKRLRTINEVFEYVSLKTCRPSYILKYNNDVHSKLFFFFELNLHLCPTLFQSGLRPIGYCCDNHPNDTNIFAAALCLHPFTIPPVDKPKKPRPVYRSVEDRAELDDLLKTWRRETCISSSFARYWQHSMVISDKDISKLARARIGSITQPSDVTALLDESLDWELFWAFQILTVLNNYNNDSERFKRRQDARAQADLASEEGSDGSSVESEDDTVNTVTPQALQDLSSNNMDSVVPGSTSASDTSDPMDIDEETVSMTVNELIFAKEAILAGNSLALKLERQQHRKTPATLLSRPLFSSKPLILKRDSQSSVRVPLQDKTNANHSQINQIQTDDIEMQKARLILKYQFMND